MLFINVATYNIFICCSSVSFDQSVTNLITQLGNYEPQRNVTTLGTPILQGFACINCLYLLDRAQCNEVVDTYTINHQLDDLLEQLNLQTVEDATSFLKNISLSEHPEKPLKFYISPLILLFGIVGNILSFIVLTRKSMRYLSTYNYLAVLSVADSLVLLTGLLPRWLAMFFDEDLRDHSIAVCRTFYAFAATFSDYAVWLLVAVTVDRYVAVVHSLSASTYCARSRALRVIGALLLLMLSINSHFFFSSDVRMEEYKPHSDGRKCGLGQGTITDSVWPWADAVIYSFLPFIAISILNSLIIHHLSTAKRQRQIMSATMRMNGVAYRSANTTERQQSRASSQVNGSVSTTGATVGSSTSAQESGTRLTAMLLTVTFAFLVTTLPTNFMNIASAFLQGSSNVLDTYSLLYDIAELLMCSNHAMNFYLYCATGRRFRQQLCALLHCRRKNAARQTSSQSVRANAQTLLRPNRSSSITSTEHRIDYSVTCPSLTRNVPKIVVT